ncbi:hypothetical protein D3C75_1251670 [compost metagenome]|uniref:hypothetical protein n=1 Tax=Pseudomonas sp. BF-R-05 TaxID=2832364 RepID=UPI000FB5BEED|nr:hypothetical protein [Pseudomonas sp. BF-R-05]
MKEINEALTSISHLKRSEFKSISISLPYDLSRKISKAAYKNKRNGVGPKSVSAIVRQVLEAAGY